MIRMSSFVAIFPVVTAIEIVIGMLSFALGFFSQSSQALWWQRATAASSAIVDHTAIFRRLLSRLGMFDLFAARFVHVVEVVCKRSCRSDLVVTTEVGGRLSGSLSCHDFHPVRVAGDTIIIAISFSVAIPGNDTPPEAQLVQRPGCRVLGAKCTVVLLDCTTNRTSVPTGWLCIVAWVKICWAIGQTMAYWWSARPTAGTTEVFLPGLLHLLQMYSCVAFFEFVAFLV